MERRFNFSVDEYYHVYSRGTERREIFLDKHDRERFIKLLYILNSEKAFKFRDVQGYSFGSLERGNQRTAIGAYCLMPNHFHLLVRETEEGGLSLFMQKLLTAYSMYFNKKYARSGRLFESTFRAQFVDNDNYLKYLFAYIHLNPVKLLEPEWKEKGIQDEEKALEYLKQYRYSSFNEHMGEERDEEAILSKEHFPGYFEEPKDFKELLSDWLNYRDGEEEAIAPENSEGEVEDGIKPLSISKEELERRSEEALLDLEAVLAEG